MKKEIGNTLRRYREEKQLNQEDVAKRLGGNLHGYISRIENGVSGPSPKYLLKLLKLYEKSEAQFILDLAGEYLPKNPQ